VVESATAEQLLEDVVMARQRMLVRIRTLAADDPKAVAADDVDQREIDLRLAELELVRERERGQVK
jgi:hypothetical protein